MATTETTSNAPAPPRADADIGAVLKLDSGNRTTWRARLRKAIAAVGFVVVSVLLVVAYQSRGPSDALHHVTEPAARGDLHVVVTATGSIQPTTKVDVSSELSGTVRRVLVDFNSPVTAGQPLAELDTDKLQATVAASRAKLGAARAKVKEAEATIVEKAGEYRRKKALAERHVASIHDLDAAKAAHDRAVAALASARAEVGVAEADLKLNETNLAKACICSPISGIVLRRNVDPGQTVASSLQAPVLFSIAENLTQMEVQVDVDEADVGQVKVGQNAIFAVDAYPGRKFPATIRDLRFASETIQGVVTYKAVLTVDNAELLLRPGMTATAEIGVHDVKNALLVPNAALRYSPPAARKKSPGLLKTLLPGLPQFRPPSQRDDAGPERKVWVLRDGAPAAVAVEVGATDGKRTEIVGGALEPGEAIVVDSVPAKRGGGGR